MNNLKARYCSMLIITFVLFMPWSTVKSAIAVPIPAVTSISTGSIGEDYDTDNPIIIRGDYFQASTVRVYFNDIEVDDVDTHIESGTGKPYLEVYLPHYLDPSLYNITVANDETHKLVIYGALSVIKTGENPTPEENKYIKKLGSTNENYIRHYDDKGSSYYDSNTDRTYQRQYDSSRDRYYYQYYDSSQDRYYYKRYDSDTGRYYDVDYNNNDNNDYGDGLGSIEEKVKVSEGTLQLNRDYMNQNTLILDMDKLMGTDTLVRKIDYTGYQGDKMGQLKTTSRWANINMFDVTLNSYYSNDNISLRLGRVEASQIQALKAKLRGWQVKSDFIEADGINFKASKIEVRIPYQSSNGFNLKVLRYSEANRTWEEVPSAINWFDGTITASSTGPGIFVAVE